MTTQTPERTIRSTESVFDEAKTEFYEICGEVDAAYEAKGYDVDSIPKAPYWLQVARATTERINHKYSDIDMTERDLSKASALELAGHTPFFIIANQKLRLDGTKHPSARPISDDERQDLLLFRTHYLGLLRDYAKSHIETVNTAQLNRDLLEILKKTEITRHPDALASLLSERINGAQKEVLGTQILNLLGKTKDSTPEEDLNGIDSFFIPNEQFRSHISGQELPVDYKSSSRELVNSSFSGIQTRAALRRGKLLLNFDIDQEDHKGRFFLSEKVALRYAGEMKPFIEEALTGSRHSYTTESL